jgi:hypothetical protein
MLAGHQKLEEFAAWLPHQTGWGSLIFLGVWVVAMLCCSPSTPLWLIGGYCFRHDFRKALALNMAGCWLVNPCPLPCHLPTNVSFGPRVRLCYRLHERAYISPAITTAATRYTERCGLFLPGEGSARVLLLERGQALPPLLQLWRLARTTCAQRARGAERVRRNPPCSLPLAPDHDAF